MANLLIADDSYSELQIFQAAPEPTGHRIITVMDGEAAEEKVKAEPINLIILDVIMPKKNGFQVCRTLKTDEKYKHIPIIMCTQKDQDSDKFWGWKQARTSISRSPSTLPTLSAWSRSTFPNPRRAGGASLMTSKSMKRSRNPGAAALAALFVWLPASPAPGQAAEEIVWTGERSIYYGASRTRPMSLRG